MGNKDDHQHLETGGANGATDTGIGTSSLFCCHGCSIWMYRISHEFSFKCVFVLILSLALLVSGIFWIFPFHTRNSNGFDAKEAIKLSATAQAYFKLPKPVSEVVPHIEVLESDIFSEINVPDMKVAMLSMHQNGTSNWTDGVFGVLSNPMNAPLNPAHLNLLRAALVDLFLKQINLSVNTSVFGEPYDFEILKFPGGVTVIPLQYGSVWQPPEPLFNFTLNSSISEILHNFGELRDQLKSGLRLRPYENIYLQITNTAGSTIQPPVTLEASVSSAFGRILPQRLQQLAEAIRDSNGKNLGLRNPVFGKVKGVILSSYFNSTINPTPPTPAPAPSPVLSYVTEPSASPYPNPTHHPVSPSPSPSHSTHKHLKAPKRAPRHFFPPVNSPSPAPSIQTPHPPRPCPYFGRKFPPPPPTRSPSPSPSPSSDVKNFFHPDAPPPQLPPKLSPLPAASYSSTPTQGSEPPLMAPPPSAQSPSSFAGRLLIKQSWLLRGLWCLVIFHLCLQHW